MKFRSSAIILAILLVISFSGCHTVSMRDIAGTDLAAVEAESALTGPLELIPTFDIFDIRLPVVTITVPQSLDEETALGNITTAKESYESAKRLSAPLGMGFGNGITIDYRGNVYIDPFVHLVEETQGDYVLKNMNRRLERTGDAYRATFPVTPSVEATFAGDEISVRRAFGGYTITKGEGEINLVPDSLLTGVRATASVKGNRATLEMQKLFTSRIAITRSEYGAFFNERKDMSFPSYSIKKKGDAYTIVKQDRVNPETYKIYFLEKKILVFAEGRLRDIFEFDGSGVLMNKKPFIRIER